MSDGARSATGDTDVEPAIRALDIRRYYDATAALAGADLEVQPGEIHGLVGENGAGKSTLVRILAGIEHPDGGTVELFGVPVAGNGTARRAELGVAFIHQDLALVENMSVADNIAMTAGYPSRFGYINDKATDARARVALKKLDLEIDSGKLVAELTLAQRSGVAIARALATGARLIVLDEPTAKLHAREVRSLFKLLGALRAEGVACLLITHRLDDIRAVCDRITVLRDGETVAVRPAAGLDEQELVRLIIGRETSRRRKGPAVKPTGPPLLEVDGLCGLNVGPISMKVRPGEIVGVTGLADAGHPELGELIFGITETVDGTMRFRETDFAPASCVDAVEAGLGYVPSDRMADGLAVSLAARENLYLYPLRNALRLLRKGPESVLASETLRAFDVRPPDPERDLQTLSGGNQQKVLLAKWLTGGTSMVILNEPTAAVDVGAKLEIYDRLRTSCREDGLGVLVLTSDFEEASALCDRVTVLRRGAAVGELAGSKCSVGAITKLAYGGAT